MILQKTFSPYLKAFLNWDEESVEAVSLEKWFLLVDNHALIKASHTMISDVKWVGVSEECQRIGIVDLVRASIASRQGNQDIIDHVQNLNGKIIHPIWINSVLSSLSMLFIHFGLLNFIGFSCEMATNKIELRNKISSSAISCENCWMEEESNNQ